MRIRTLIPLTLACSALAFWAGAVASPRPGEAADISTLLTPARDFEAEVKVTRLDTKELEKIGRDWATTYRLRNLTLLFKNPDKIRLEGKSNVLGTAVLILNGSKRFYSVPRLGLKRTEMLDEAPMKQQSLLEYGGLVSRDTLRFMKPTFVTSEDLDGKKALVFDLYYQNSESKMHYRCWIDPETRITRKRVWYGSDEKVKATFRYGSEREAAPGVWVPGTCEIRTAEDVPAAELTFSAVKINQGLPDSLFAVTP